MAQSNSTNDFEIGDDTAMTYHTFALGKNKILVRFTNLADRFDLRSQDTTFVNVTKFAETFY